MEAKHRVFILLI